MGWLYLLIFYFVVIRCQKPDFVLVVDDFDVEMIKTASVIARTSNADQKKNFEYVLVRFEENVQNVTDQVRILIQNGADLVADFTCEGLHSVKNLANHGQIPYIHVRSPLGQYVQATADYLQLLETNDAALLFSDKSGFEHAFCHVLDNVVIQILLVEGLSMNNLNKLRNMTTRHSHYVIFGESKRVDDALRKAFNKNLMLGDSRWIVALQDDQNVEFSQKVNKLTVMKPSMEFICKLASFKNVSCNCHEKDCFDFYDLRNLYYQTVTTFFGKVTTDNLAREVSMDVLKKELETGVYPMHLENENLIPDLGLDYYIKTDYQLLKVGYWNKSQVNIYHHDWKKLTRRKLKIGSILEMPFLYEAGKNYLGDKEYGGFNMDFLAQLRQQLRFDFELVFPPDGVYGIFDNDTIPPRWNGLMGLSVNRSVDLILAPLSMTAERAMYVDFVTPYFDQTGIGILGRRAEREQSLFKFMTVLTPKVWWCILAAIIAVSLSIWFVDKYSPYSGTNTGEPNCRKFTIKESLWFTLTSFTPQGGGEAPMSLSGRVLVAVYWLFVVLILATFSANLSALLTVERMESQVNSLDDMAKETNFNYTTLASSSFMQYFQNMAKAEDEIYDNWKKVTLNANSDYSRYRVWDYPVKERYKHMFDKIQEVGPVLTVEEGIAKVKANEKGHFAFIADINTVRYTVNQDCDFIQIGEVFGEHPYAIALTKGSSMLEAFSNTVMSLQRSRFFENQMSIYWNSTKRQSCNADKDNLGIYDLGGVFIAMAIGMSIALLALFVEVRLLAPKKIVVHPAHSRDDPVARIGTLMPDGKIVHNDVHICRPEPGCLGFRNNIKINTITW